MRSRGLPQQLVLIGARQRPVRPRQWILHPQRAKCLGADRPRSPHPSSVRMGWPCACCGASHGLRGTRGAFGLRRPITRTHVKTGRGAGLCNRDCCGGQSEKGGGGILEHGKAPRGPTFWSNAARAARFRAHLCMRIGICGGWGCREKPGSPRIFGNTVLDCAHAAGDCAVTASHVFRHRSRMAP
jgi:hypothetical protein